MLKPIKEYLLEGMAWGCVILIGRLLFEHTFLPENFAQTMENFTLYAISHILITAGFVFTCIVHEIEHLHIGLRLLIQMIAATSILLIFGFSFGLYHPQNLSYIPLDLLNNMPIIFLLWTYYYLKERRELQKINAKLLEKNTKN